MIRCLFLGFYSFFESRGQVFGQGSWVVHNGRLQENSVEYFPFFVGPDVFHRTRNAHVVRVRVVCLFLGRGFGHEVPGRFGPLWFGPTSSAPIFSFGAWAEWAGPNSPVFGPVPFLSARGPNGLGRTAQFSTQYSGRTSFLPGIWEVLRRLYRRQSLG